MPIDSRAGRSQQPLSSPGPEQSLHAPPHQGPVLLEVLKEKLEEVRVSSRQGEQMAGRGGRGRSRCCGRGA